MGRRTKRTRSWRRRGAEPKTGSKAWLRRRLHAAIVREHLDASEQ